MSSNWTVKLSTSVVKHMLTLPSLPIWVKRVHNPGFFYGYQPLLAAGSTLNRYAAFLARSLSESSIPAYLPNLTLLIVMQLSWQDHFQSPRSQPTYLPNLPNLPNQDPFPVHPRRYCKLFSPVEVLPFERELSFK